MNKIVRHYGLLRGRNLSVRGLATIASSLLLSGLWHILQVAPAPTKWLTRVQSIIRNFVLPFWPKPSWTTICRPKTHHGSGVVDILAQSKDYLSPWLVHSRQINQDNPHSGPPHKAAAIVATFLSSICFMDFPLVSVVHLHPDFWDPPPRISFRSLISDIAAWNSRSNVLEAHRTHTVSRPVLKRVFDRVYYLFYPDAIPCQLNHYVSCTLVFINPRESYTAPKQ
ncbi:hypothetical protein G6F57_011006 [Rhizopus arrhizus]|nr:hypothetical protein G6F30_011157 [Rhizopus arrhizus]KAG1411406.1 hypothetical protein G6F58_008568 [Rhizopus delemar]KAG0975748.1 hypothetical protein G6F29_011311 [Rhizopus arrhizus]KAG0983025.1 hypothetical protein G6F28_011051 [Rhizopus arrhizus]KAG1004014.1 hypothetical protein G6F27_010530 [Rhizopus arrhizus]